MKIKTIFATVAVVSTSVVSAYYYGKHFTPPKEIIVEKEVEKIVEVESVDQKLYESQMDFNRRLYIQLVRDLGIQKSTKEEYATLIQDSKWLAILMYRECGVCTINERTFVGVSAIEFMRTKDYGATMENLVKYVNRNSGQKFVSFTDYSIPADKEKEYVELAMQLIERLPAVEDYWLDYIHAKQYVRVKNKDGIYWCNMNISPCQWHKNMLVAGKFKKFWYDVRPEHSRISPIFQEDIAKHTFFVLK